MSDNIAASATPGKIATLTAWAEKIRFAANTFLEKKRGNAAGVETAEKIAENREIESCLGMICSYMIADLFLRDSGISYKAQTCVDFFDWENGSLRLLSAVCDENWPAVAKVIRACARINKREHGKWAMFVAGSTFFMETIPHVFSALLSDQADANEDFEDAEVFEMYLIGFCQ